MIIKSITLVILTLLGISVCMGVDKISIESTIVVDPEGDSINSSNVSLNIQHAVNRAREGCVILVKEGTYQETVQIRTKGITIAALDPLHPPVITGCIQTIDSAGWQHVENNIYRCSYQWYKPQLTSDEFNRYGGGTHPEHIAIHVYEDDVLLRGYVGAFQDYWGGGNGGPYTSLSQLNPKSLMFYPGVWYKQEIRIPGRFLYDEANRHLYIWSAKENHPEKNRYLIPAKQNLVIIDASSVTLRNLVLANSAGYALTVEDYADEACIEGCYFVNDMYPIYIKKADSVIIARNFIQQKGMWERYWYYDCKGTILWSHAITIEHYKETEERFTEIIGNYIHGYYSGILANSKVNIHNNIISYCMSTHINVDKDCSEINIHNNVFHHVDDSSIGVSGTFCGPIRVFRNVFYHCSSLNKAGNDVLVDTGRCYFYHNTFALGSLIAHHPYDFPLFGTHIYRNNIFYLQYREPGSELYWRYAEKDPALGWLFQPFKNGPDADYDLYWIGPGGPTRYIAYFSYKDGLFGEHLYDNYEKMKRETELDLHGWQMDPKMHIQNHLKENGWKIGQLDELSSIDYLAVIAKGGGAKVIPKHHKKLYDAFSLAKESPALNKGMILPLDWPGVVTDRDKNPDIGAHQISSNEDFTRNDATIEP